MLRLWKHKWLVVVGALTIFLSVGAVAWAATDDESDSAAGARAAVLADTTSTTAPGGQADIAVQRPGQALREALREKRQQRLERLQALTDALRGDMTPADQATYDQLVSQAKAQREALQQARQNLANTLKDLRDLTDKYLHLGNGASGG
jgi:hypothetical protein